MSLSEYRSTSAAAALFQMRHLELAPEGWRACVDRVAQGIVNQGKEWHSPIVTDTSVRRILDFQTVLG
jgi:hypothetical protein